MPEARKSADKIEQADSVGGFVRDRVGGSQVRKLGIVGGMSWSSTALYYEHINRGVAQRLGGLHSAPLAIESLDFAQIAAMEFAGDWDGIAKGVIGGREAARDERRRRHRSSPATRPQML